MPLYTYTGQYSYRIPYGDMDDPTTSGAEGPSAGSGHRFGLMFYREASRAALRRVDNARWYDPALGRFAQADSVVPGGVQGLDRYAYTNNNPVKYIDPSGHVAQGRCNYLKNYLCEAPKSGQPKPTADDSVRQIDPEMLAAMLGFTNVAEYESWCGTNDTTRSSCKMWNQAQLGDIMKMEVGGSYTTAMFVKYKGGVAMYDITGRELVRSPELLKFISSTQSGWARFGDNDGDGNYTYISSSEGFRGATTGFKLPSGWNRASDGKGIVQMTPTPTTEEALSLAVGAAGFIYGAVTGTGWAALSSAGWDLYTLATDVDQVPEYLDQRPPRVP